MANIHWTKPLALYSGITVHFPRGRSGDSRSDETRKKASACDGGGGVWSFSLPPSRDLSVRDVTLAKVFLPNFLIAWERATD